MSRLTLRLPETLHQQLVQLAESEGVSLNQYIVYALTRQVTGAYAVRAASVEEIRQQEKDMQAMQHRFNRNSPDQVKAILDRREVVQPEPDLNPEAIDRLRQILHNASKVE